ncbi:MAG: hypothetical protein ABTB30_16140, partial [Clostridia bacterium]
MANTQTKRENGKRRHFKEWLRSSSFLCTLLILAAFLIILGIFLCVCTPKKYDLTVGAISHVTVDATKDIVDEVSTEEKKNAAAETIEPSYLFQQGVKEEVLSSLDSAFQEMRTIQQYGVTLRSGDDKTAAYNRPFSEEEIAYALSLTTDLLDLNRTQLTTLMRVDTPVFEEMVSTVTVAVENSLNSRILEGQVSQSILNIQQIVGYKIDISLMQNIIPTVLRTCIKPNMIINEEATEEARQKARDAVEPVIYLQGQNIIREGDKISRSQIEVLRALGLLNDNHYDYSVYGGALMLTALAMISLLMMLRLLMKDVLSDIRRLSVLLIILILCFGFASLTTLLPSLYIIPIALGPILATVLIGYRAGLVMTVPLALLFAGITSVSSLTTFYDVVLIMANCLSGGMATVWFLKGRPQ